MKEIRSKVQPNWGFRLSLNRTQIKIRLHQCQQHFQSLWSVLVLFPEYRKRHKGLLD
jgi:hypothetical protein